jgi:hypothetical protein
VVLRRGDRVVAEYFVNDGRLTYLQGGRARPLQTRPAEKEEQLIAEALQCLHSLDRAVKRMGPSWSSGPGGAFMGKSSEVACVYALKDRFLEAMVLSGYASVGHFQTRRFGRTMCKLCERVWVGQSKCYACGEHSGVPLQNMKDWYLIDCGNGYRFHCPGVSEEVKQLASPVEPHDPRELRCGIVDVELDRPAQVLCVQKALQALQEPQA